MKKKVKKIPKFKDGGLTWKDMSNNQRWNAGIEAVGAIGNTIGTAMSGQDVTLGGALSSAGSLAATGFKIGGPIGAGVGAAAGLIAGTAGRKNSVNENSTSTSVADIAEEGSGWMKWFGMSEEEMMAKANRIANANISEHMTEQIRSKYAMNPNNPNGGTILAAEGGIMRKPVDALVSKGELIYDPTTKKLRQVPGSKGKPNKADDVFARLYEGDVVISNSPTMIMSNGKTPAQNLMGMVDKYATGGTVKAREAIIKKVVNWLEANKTKPQEYAKFGEGIYYVDGQRAEYRHGRWWWNEGGKKDAQGKMYFVPYTGKSTPSETEPIKHTSETPVGPLDPAYRQHVRYSSTNDVERKATVSKPSSSKKTTTTSRVTTSTAPSPEDTVVRRPIYEEPVKTATVPTDDTKVYGRDGRVAYDYTVPETKVAPQDLGRTADNNANYTGSNWQDNLYRMAVLSQPLWDRAEAEPVNYESPVYKYMPTQIDVSSQFRDADQSYALSRYNFANLYPNTGAGMAAGLQAASNRAKQYADIRQWQTNAQNELIGKNVGIYNNWANEHARILNDVYNKSAQNRATARNINRLNMSTSLTNVGKMMLEDKQLALNESLLNGLIPTANAVLENPYSVINPLRKLTKNYGSKQV